MSAADHRLDALSDLLPILRPRQQDRRHLGGFLARGSASPLEGGARERKDTVT